MRNLNSCAIVIFNLARTMSSDSSVQFCHVGACVICKQQVGNSPLAKVTSGLSTLRQNAMLRDRLDIVECLDANPVEVLVHQGCRKTFHVSHKEAQKRIAQNEQCPVSISAKVLRSSSEVFLSAVMCLFCGKPVTLTDHKAMTMTMCETVKAAIKSRMDKAVLLGHEVDQWTHDVNGRMQHFADLVAADVVYHKACHSRFMTGLTQEAGEVARGKPIDDIAEQAF